MAAKIELLLAAKNQSPLIEQQSWMELRIVVDRKHQSYQMNKHFVLVESPPYYLIPKEYFY